MKCRTTSFLSAVLAALTIYITAVPTLSAAGSSAPSVPPAPPMPISEDFSDVDESHLFYNEIARLCSMGVLHGYPDGTFRSENEITNAEFVKVLLRCLDITPADTRDTLFPESWAYMYLTEAHTRGILTDAMLASGFAPNDPITRGMMTEMTVRALGIYVPTASESPFKDTDDRYAVAAYEEYILRGYPTDDGKRLCKPDSHATRGEASAIAVRVTDYRADPYNYKKKAVLDNASTYPLTTETEFLDLFYVLNREFITEFTFTTELPYDQWLNYYRLANVLYLEYYYSAYLNCSYKKNSNVYKITLEFTDDIEILKNCHTASEAMADAVLSLILTEDMTDREKVKAIHDYLVLNCEYNYDGYTSNTLTYRSRIAYGALCERKAICQGYCAAFNLLARKAGLRASAVTGYAPGNPDKHAWNMVYVDGGIYYIDATHDDPVPDRKGSVSYKYFMLTEKQMLDMGYIWDAGQTQMKYLY